MEIGAGVVITGRRVAGSSCFGVELSSAGAIFTGVLLEPTEDGDVKSAFCCGCAVGGGAEATSPAGMCSTTRIPLIDSGP